MAQILFRLKDNAHDDPEKDRRGCYKKGYPVSIKPDGWYEGNPNWHQSAYADKTKWVVVDVTDATKEELEQYTVQWRDNFDYEILATRQGEYDVRVFEKNVSASGTNRITLPKVQEFLLLWGCTGISEATNSVSFTFSLWNAVRSEGFWRVPDLQLKGSFVLNSYAAGVGNVTFTVIPAAFLNMDEAKITQMISRKVQERGGSNLVVAYPAFTFDIERSDILRRFREEVKRKGERTYKRRQFSLTPAQADAIAAAGGYVQMTKAQLVSIIRNGLED